jgi:hypothetical protein
MGFSNEGGWGTFIETSPSGTPDSSVKGGAGGGVMPVWKASRSTKINNLATAAFTNNSSFAVPKAFVATGGWDAGGISNEKNSGVWALGQALATDSKPLSGTASIEAGGSRVESASIEGSFAISAPAPTGVKQGADSSIREYDFKFEPSGVGLALVQSKIGAGYDAGVFQYGRVTGTVTDYNGNPVGDALVSGAGAAAKTAADGSYTLEAPGGTTFTLEAVGTSKDYTPSAGQEIAADWQFARLQVQVVTPDLDPVIGVPVTINDTDYVTDADGKVTIDTASIQSYDISLDDGVASDSLTVSSQGSENTTQFGDSYAAARVVVTDSVSRREVASIPVQFSEGVSAESDSTGTAAVVTPDASETTVTIDPAGERYNTTEVEVSLTKGSTVEKTVRLEQDVTIGGN